MEQDLDLHAPAALALLRRRLLPDGPGTAERFRGFPGPVELLEAVTPAEEAEVIGRERGEGAVVPAQRLRPLLLPLEVPADGAVEDGRTPGGELGTTEEVALHLLLVAEHAEGPPDLVEQVGRVPGLPLRRVVERAVAGDDGVVGASFGEGADVGEDRAYVVHGAVPVRCGADLTPCVRASGRPPAGVSRGPYGSPSPPAGWPAGPRR